MSLNYLDLIIAMMVAFVAVRAVEEVDNFVIGCALVSLGWATMLMAWATQWP